MVNFTSIFLDETKSKFPVYYNKKKGICVLADISCCKEIGKIQEICRQKYPKIILWVAIDIARKDCIVILQHLVRNNFEHPYMTVLTPMYTDISPSIALSCEIPSQAFRTSRESQKTVMFKISHVIQQYKQDTNACFLHAILTPKAIKFLKSTSISGYKKAGNGKIIQTEMGGELYVKNVESRNGNFVYRIDINLESVEMGKQESIDVIATRYNFHSHPRDAYIRHSVHNGWPSVTDFLGYLQMGKNTIFHCVATLEGLYVISFGSYWSQRLDKISKKFVDKNYEIDLKKNYTPKKYTEIVNNILYKGHPIYFVQYFSWEKADSVIKVFFPQIGSACIVSQKIYDNYTYMFEKKGE